MKEKRRSNLDLAPLAEALSPFGVLVAVRRIRAGDESGFLDLARAKTPMAIARRRASGAARLAARRLLPELNGDAAAPLPRSTSGAPAWPDSFVGSLAHDDSYGAAAIGRRGALVGIGIDIEPAEPLPADLVDFVLTPPERRETSADPVAQRLVFAAKEAVYKAIHPLDGSALEYADITIRLFDGAATLRDGRRLRLFTLRAARLVAVALVLDGAPRLGPDPRRRSA